MNTDEDLERTVALVVAEEIKKRRTTIIASAMLLLLKKKKSYKKKKYWVAPIFQNRSEHGFYFASMPKLLLKDIQLLGIIRLHIQKQDVIRQSVTPSERLALTLRYVNMFISYYDIYYS
ncbi:hypothetical protein PUN28_009847 [Cardiocondyla obscurior]|uniref:Uncharacterized protein n=1 Tax=Cardiocondyla obscurior TaxID=286306 RepID=A0AAW2FKI7_9HYME